MATGTSRPGAADLELLRAVLAHQAGAWTRFVQQCQNDIYGACRLACPDAEAKNVFVTVMTQLRANEFALLRPFDGRASLSSFLRLVVRDLLAERIAGLLAQNPERGWRAFEHFFRRDILRSVARYFPAADSDADDIYHDIVSALIEDDWRRIRAYDGQGSFGGFVLRIVNNLCIDRLRKDVPRRRPPAAIQRLSEIEQEIFRQLYWEKCPDHQLATALRGRKIELAPPALAASVAAVRSALPANFSVAGEETRVVAVLDPDDERSGVVDLPDERPTPEESAILSQDEQALAAATTALQAAVADLPADIRLYLQHVMAGNGTLPAREIARLMARPVGEVYRLRQQAERQLKRALAEHPAVKNLGMTV